MSFLGEWSILNVRTTGYGRTRMWSLHRRDYREASQPKVVMRKIAARLVVALLVLGSVASAHNTGYVLLPDGNYVSVGSGKQGPEVPEANKNRNVLDLRDEAGRLDLMPETVGAQFGASVRGNLGQQAGQTAEQERHLPAKSRIQGGASQEFNCGAPLS